LPPGERRASQIGVHRRRHHRGLRRYLPDLPGKRYEDWPVDDPADRDIDTVRRIVDDVDARVRKLLEELGVPV
jgi:protein-tyrosine-phosphatase